MSDGHGASIAVDAAGRIKGAWAVAAFAGRCRMSSDAQRAVIDALEREREALYRAYLSYSGTWALAKLHAGIDPDAEAQQWMQDNRERLAAVEARLRALDQPLPPLGMPLAGAARALSVSAQSVLSGPLVSWFAFAETSRSGPQGDPRVEMRPQGAAFHDRVRLLLQRHGDDAITRASLELARSFVDARSTAPFAVDVLRGFLTQLIGPPDAAAAAALASAIPFAWAGARVIQAASAPAAQAALPLALERVLEGHSQRVDVPLGTHLLRWENRSSDTGEPLLAVTVTRPDDARAPAR